MLSKDAVKQNGVVGAAQVISGDRLAHSDPLYHCSLDADFVHSARRNVSRAGRSAYETYAELAAVVPAWFDALMRFRNVGMRALGMKDLGSLSSVEPNDEVTPGQRAGIFTVQSNEFSWLILEDDDKHLRVQLALWWLRTEGRDELIVSTVVHVHNALGRAYMVPVAPTHRWIMPLLLRRLNGRSLSRLKVDPAA